MIINALEYKLLAMRRSGSHALLQWIQAQAGGSGVHLNSCYAEGSPFAYCGGDSQWNGYDPEAEMSGRHAPKDWLTYNYENQLPEKVWGHALEDHRDAHVGASARSFDLILIRSFQNWIASYLPWYYGRENCPDLRLLRSLIPTWTAHAHEAANPTVPGLVVIYYDVWATSKDYRELLAGRLGLEFTDAGKEAIPRYGGGSSFEGYEFDGKASEMDVTNRFRNYTGDPIFASLTEGKITPQALYSIIRSPADLPPTGDS